MIDSAGDERVLILARTQRDATITRTILESIPVAGHICSSLQEACLEIGRGAGLIMLTEHALAGEEFNPLIEALQHQPPWSDLPVLVMLRDGADSPAARLVLKTLGNAMILERPVRVAMLVSTIQMALQSRRRQYQIRDYLEERERREQLLRESEESYRRILETANEGIWMVDAGGVTAFVNARMAAMLGYTVEEFMSISAWDFGFKEDLPIAEESWEQRHRGVSERRDIRLRHKNGSTVWVAASVTPMYDKDANFAGGFGMFTDITARTQAEEALMESQERFRRLAEQVPGILFTALPNGTFDYVNTRFFEYTGIEPAAGSPVDFEEVIHPEDRVQSAEIWHRVRKSGEPFEQEMRLRGADGTYAWFVTRSRPIWDSSGKIVKWFGTTTNIDVVKQQEEERLQEELTRAIWQEQQRVGQELHDTVCQELTGLSMMTKSLYDVMARKKVEGLQPLSAILNQLQSTTQNVRSLARDLFPVQIDANGWLNSIGDYLTVIETRHNIRCIFDFEDTITIKSNYVATHLFRIVQEAVTNALKHAVGSVIEVQLYSEEGEIILSIEDDGVGIKPDSQRAGGMGLLTMRYRARAIGATIQVTTVEGGGTKVTCILKGETVNADGQGTTERYEENIDR